MEIKEYREINKGCLKAAFQLVIPEWGNMRVHCTYFEKDGGSSWINTAPKEYTTPEGVKKTFNLVGWDETTTAALNRAVKDKIKKGDYQKKILKNQQEQEKEIFEKNEELPF